MTERFSPSVSSEILSYYEDRDEANRLAKGAGLLEFARMQEIIQRFLPAPPGEVLDVGGGPGQFHAGSRGVAIKSISSIL